MWRNTLGNMKVLIACEFSGTVRDEFLKYGHDAVSCDLLPSLSDKGRHIQGDVLDVINGESWDMMIAHPPCTYLTTAGNRHFKDNPERERERERESFRVCNVSLQCGHSENLYGEPARVSQYPLSQTRPDNSPMAIWRLRNEKNMSVAKESPETLLEYSVSADTRTHVHSNRRQTQSHPFYGGMFRKRNRSEEMAGQVKNISRYRTCNGGAVGK